MKIKIPGTNIHVEVMPDDQIPTEAFLMLLPTRMGPSYVPSNTVECTVCKQECYVSKLSGQPQLDRGLTPMCMECVMKMRQKGNA